MVAQLDRVTDYESVGRGFESLPSHQEKPVHIVYWFFFFVCAMEGARTGRRMFSIAGIDLLEQELLNHERTLLEILLQDKTTKKNIIWATDDYAELGEPYSFKKEILPELVTGEQDSLIQPRVEKALEHQTNRTRDKAEAFTPSWICNAQNNLVDAQRLEISCGEAPYLVSRYDTVTGETIPISQRIGLLDRKLRVVSENTDTEEQIDLCPGCKKIAA